MIPLPPDSFSHMHLNTAYTCQVTSNHRWKHFILFLKALHWKLDLNKVKIMKTSAWVSFSWQSASKTIGRSWGITITNEGLSLAKNFSIKYSTVVVYMLPQNCSKSPTFQGNTNHHFSDFIKFCVTFNGHLNFWPS